MKKNLTSIVSDGFRQLNELGRLSEANCFLLYAYLMLWNRTGNRAHVVHTYDSERHKDVFIAEF